MSIYPIENLARDKLCEYTINTKHFFPVTYYFPNYYFLKNLVKLV